MCTKCNQFVSEPIPQGPGVRKPLTCPLGHRALGVDFAFGGALALALVTMLVSSSVFTVFLVGFFNHLERPDIPFGIDLSLAVEEQRIFISVGWAVPVFISMGYGLSLRRLGGPAKTVPGGFIEAACAVCSQCLCCPARWRFWIAENSLESCW